MNNATEDIMESIHYYANRIVMAFIPWDWYGSVWFPVMSGILN